MPRYKIKIEYDGTGFAGWQKQPDVPTIQGCLEQAIYSFCQEKVETIVAGRTDAGVHALEQVAHFDTEREYDLFSMTQAINFHLGEAAISVLSSEEVSDEFSARFSAKRRYYRYIIVNRRSRLAIDINRAWYIPVSLDIERMKQAASYLIGNHDFSSFRSVACQAKSPEKTLEKVEISREGEKIFIDVSAPSFLHNMVRIIVGNLKMVGSGDWPPEKIKTILEARDRTISGPTASACGLYLMRVEY